MTPKLDAKMKSNDFWIWASTLNEEDTLFPRVVKYARKCFGENKDPNDWNGLAETDEFVAEYNVLTRMWLRDEHPLLMAIIDNAEAENAMLKILLAKLKRRTRELEEKEKHREDTENAVLDMANNMHHLKQGKTK